jgi:mxaA protein
MRWRAFAILLALVGAHGLAAEPAAPLNATPHEPRAFGYQVGDVLSRSVSLHVPEGLVLDESSVPLPGARGKALELRGVARHSHGEPGGQRFELALDYQVFLSPPEVRTLELPTFTLRFTGQPREQTLRIEAWPVTVAPLVPVEVSPRRGLGELQPDTPAPLIEIGAARMRLLAYAGVLLLLLAYLARVYFVMPWWSRAHRPFTRAWRALGRLPPGGSEAQRRAAFQRLLQGLHEAFNLTAGEVVFEPGVDRFIAARPRFQPLRDDIATFFRQSRREFFASGESADADRAWLTGFCRRCCDAERGAA